MTRISTPKILLAVLLVGVMLVFAGCFMTKYTLIPPDQARVNRAFVGNWNSDSFRPEGRDAGLVIRNIDDKLYYVEWATANDAPGGTGRDLTRAVGFIADVKGVTFAQLRGLGKDGSLDDEWLLVRLELAGDKLTIRHLSEDFFKDKKIESSAQLRQVLEQNLNNESMYAKDEEYVATRAAEKK
jgi:hypothetical protein